MVLGTERTLVLAREHRLAAGLRVRARLARPSDVQLLGDLLGRIGLEAQPLQLARALRYDPRRRAVACLTTLLGATETMIALGAVDLDRSDAEPDLLLVDPTQSPEVDQLLRRMLDRRANARQGNHAA